MPSSIPEFLTTHRRMIERHIDQTILFLQDKNIKQIGKLYREFKSKELSIGFNLFLLISDTYHRENFHSDILRALLDPNEKHQEGNKYLSVFFDFLKQVSKNQLPIDIKHYQHANVLRERDRIDIQIRDETSKHAIIIENKINKAGDQLRQLPRYVDKLEEQGYTVDCIVYLLLNYQLKPDTFGWSEVDYGKVYPKLITVPASNETSNDLVNGWLQFCIKQTRNEDALFVLKQYETLLKQLGIKAMDKQIMEKFYENIMQDDHYVTALSVKSMMTDLPVYRLERIIDTFMDDAYPFDRVWNWQNRAAVFDRCNFANGVFAIDIFPEGDIYKLQFFCRENGHLSPVDMLERLGISEDFHPAGDRMQRIFKFPNQEEELYQYIRNLKSNFSYLIKAS
jgi:hypothetical protein